MSQLLRIMANLMRPDAVGPAELGFRAMELISRLLPDQGTDEGPGLTVGSGARAGTD
jgi:hypothetical protein